MTNQDQMRVAFDAWSRKWCDGVLNSDDDAGRVSRLGAWAAWQAATAAAVAAERERCAQLCERMKRECYTGWEESMLQDCADAIRSGE